MTKRNCDSILQGNPCDIVNHFRERELDYVDRLVQRAVAIVLATDQLNQTGYEVDCDQFTANMIASEALDSINASVRQYPFVRVATDAAPFTACPSEEALDEVLDSAEYMISKAEELLNLPPIQTIEIPAGMTLTRRYVVLTDGFVHG